MNSTRPDLFDNPTILLPVTLPSIESEHEEDERENHLTTMRCFLSFTDREYCYL